MATSLSDFTKGARGSIRYLRRARSMATITHLWSTLNSSETRSPKASREPFRTARSTSAGKTAAAIHEVHRQKTLGSPINWRAWRSYVSLSLPNVARARCAQTRREAQSGHETPPYPSRSRRASCGSGQLCYLDSIRPVLWHPQAFEGSDTASRSITGSQAAKDRVQLPEAARPAMPNGNDLALTASLAPSQRAGPCAK